MSERADWVAYDNWCGVRDAVYSWVFLTFGVCSASGNKLKASLDLDVKWIELLPFVPTKCNKISSTLKRAFSLLFLFFFFFIGKR